MTASTAANEEMGMNAAMEAVSSEPDGGLFCIERTEKHL